MVSYSDIKARIVEKLRIRRRPLLREAIGEFVGTFILVVIGDGSNAQAVLGYDSKHHEHGGFILITFGWGFAVMMGVFFASRVSKGLINPAVSIAFCLVDRLRPLQLLVYIIAQVIGGFFGAAVVYGVYNEKIIEYAKMVQAPGAALLTVNTTGGIFCTWPEVSNGGAFFDQVVGTALLAGGALAIVDKGRLTLPDWFHAPMLAFLVSAIVGAFAINAGAPLNPARDLGPRIFISIAGWGAEAFTYHDYYFWVPIFGPIFGAIVGVLFYELLIGIHQPDPDAEDEWKVLTEDDSEVARGHIGPGPSQMAI